MAAKADPFLSDLLATNAGQAIDVAPHLAPQPEPDEQEAPRPIARPARRSRIKVNWRDDAAFHLSAMALALAFWVVGGYFSLAALQSIGWPVVAEVAWPWQLSQAGALSWLIPIAISAIELKARRRRGWALLIFILVGGFDWITSGFGLYGWVGDRGWLARIGQGVIYGAMAGVALFSCGLTFGPERVAASSLSILWGLITQTVTSFWQVEAEGV